MEAWRACEVGHTWDLTRARHLSAKQCILCALDFPGGKETARSRSLTHYWSGISFNTTELSFGFRFVRPANLFLTGCNLGAIDQECIALSCSKPTWLCHLLMNFALCFILHEWTMLDFPVSFSCCFRTFFITTVFNRSNSFKTPLNSIFPRCRVVFQGILCFEKFMHYFTLMNAAILLDRIVNKTCDGSSSRAYASIKL